MRVASVEGVWPARSSTSRRDVSRSRMACRDKGDLNRGIPTGCLEEGGIIEQWF